MKNKYFFFLLFLSIFSFSACDNANYVTISTDYGNMTILLYDSTPGHKANFIKLVEEHFYEDLLFHRVMQGFMIQGGDPDSKTAAPGQQLGQGGPGYTIPAEIGAPHFKGVLAAARTPDQVNPEKRSSGSQFYIVHGGQVTDQMLNAIEQRQGLSYNQAQRNLYKEIGGTPQLDNDYTVFGEVVAGLEVIDKIAAVQTDRNNRPVEDVKMSIRKGK